MNFDMVQKSSLAFVKVSELDQMGILYQTESFLTACISLVHKLQQTSRDRDNSRHVRTHEKNLLRCVRRLGTIIQSIFCAQSGAGIRLNFWKWSVESRYPGALSPVIKTFVPPFLPTRLTAPGSPRMLFHRYVCLSRRGMWPSRSRFNWRAYWLWMGRHRQRHMQQKRLLLH